jgi:hypothetical protein
VWYRRLGARLLAMPLRTLAAAVGLVVLAASGLFGGLDPVKQAELPLVAAGTVNAGKPWNVAVTGAQLLDRAPLRLRRAGNRWLAVQVTVEITADESRGDLGDILRLTGVDGIGNQRPADVVLLRDQASARLLHPGLPEVLVFFWEQAGNAAVPGQIEVQIFGKKRRIDSLSGRREWLDRASRARVRLAVDDRRTPT